MPFDKITKSKNGHLKLNDSKYLPPLMPHCFPYNSPGQIGGSPFLLNDRSASRGAINNSQSIGRYRRYLYILKRRPGINLIIREAFTADPAVYYGFCAHLLPAKRFMDAESLVRFYSVFHEESRSLSKLSITA